MKATVPRSEEAAKFYDDLAAEYDAMTGFEKRFIRSFTETNFNLLLQKYASVAYGYWYARSPEFPYSPTVQTVKWFRAFAPRREQ